MKKLSDLKPNPRNPRTISRDAFEKLKASIKRDPEFMGIRPIVVDADGFVLGGNQRYRACLALGMTEVPDTWVVTAADLTDKQRERFVLMDNSPDGAAGEWDWDMLSADWEVPELTDMGFELPDVEPDPAPPNLPDDPGAATESVRLAVVVPVDGKSEIVAAVSKLGGSYVECTANLCDVELRRLDTNAWAFRRDKLAPTKMAGSDV